MTSLSLSIVCRLRLMKKLPTSILQPLDWLLPAGVGAATTLRSPGLSEGKFAGLNLGTHVGDDPQAVEQNRQMLSAALGDRVMPVYINQVHGCNVIEINSDDYRKACLQTAHTNLSSDADVLYTRDQNLALVIQVADCLPILLADKNGREVAAIHAGWRGLAAGIIRHTLEKFESNSLTAWLGPAIGPCHYEVDNAVYDRFTSTTAFKPCGDNVHWMMSLETVAKEQLLEAGLDESDIVATSTCTYCHEDYFSYRREGQTGRFAALIWITSNQASD